MSVSKGNYFIAELLPAYSQTVTYTSKRQNSSFNTEKATSFFWIASCFLYLSTCFLLHFRGFFFQTASQGCTIHNFQKVILSTDVPLTAILSPAPTKTGVEMYMILKLARRIVNIYSLV